MEESSNENDAAGLDSDNSPSFPKKSDGSDSVVNDESSKFNPNVLIHRQSKGKKKFEEYLNTLRYSL